jgi:integrase
MRRWGTWRLAGRRCGRRCPQERLSESPDRNPVSKAKLGKKRHKRERRILTFEETARVLARLEEPNLLVIETCIATGARISEVLGLKWKHVNMVAGAIKIEQRVWHQEVGRPKSEDSNRVLGIGDLVDRYSVKAAEDGATPESFVFQQKRAPGRPLWDSGVRDALHPRWTNPRSNQPASPGRRPNGYEGRRRWTTADRIRPASPN